MSTRHRPAELRIPYFRHRHRHCLKPKCRQDFGRFQAMRNLSHMLLFLLMNHLHGYKWTLGIHKSKRIQAKESSPSWSLFPVPPHANLCYSIPKPDRQTDRQTAELCRNISCLAEFRQKWVKPETDSIFGNAAIVWPWIDIKYNFVCILQYTRPS